MHLIDTVSNNIEMLDLKFHSNNIILFFRDHECANDVLERQSEMIRYLRQHNMNLGKRIVGLTQMLPKTQQQNILNDANVAPQLLPQNQR